MLELLYSGRACGRVLHAFPGCEACYGAGDGQEETCHTSLSIHRFPQAAHSKTNLSERMLRNHHSGERQDGQVIPWLLLARIRRSPGAECQ